MRLTSLALLFPGLIAAYVIAVHFGQRSVMFPRPWGATPVSLGPAERVEFGSPPALGYLLPPSGKTERPFPLIIFAHGNAELAEMWIDQFDEVRSWGWGVLLLEYPGYGGTPGSPSEKRIRQAALAAFDWAANDSRIAGDRIVAYGRSLGGGAAASLAAERPIAGLILESSFTSVRPLAARFLVPGWLVRDPFDNLAALRQYRGPLLVVHGLEDEIVPVNEGRKLAAAVAGAEIHLLECGHNDCPRPWVRMRQFLEARGLITSTSGGKPAA